jgi:hypothetical protein
MNTKALKAVIAERELEFTASDGAKQTVVVRLGKPEREPDGPWFCTYVIEGTSFRREFRAAGEDSMQAMLLARSIIVVELEVLAKDQQGHFTWFGQANLGFS